MDSFEKKVQHTLANPKNQGEMEGADSVGTVGSPECGDMLRMWLKFKERDGKKVIDKASFQRFGCQTAIAVASIATEMLKGKTIQEAEQLDAGDLSANLGELPPMKIHCGQLVEGALKNALEQGGEQGGEQAAKENPTSTPAKTLAQSIAQTKPVGSGTIKIVKLEE